MLDVPSLQNYYFLKIHQEVLKNRENNVFITKYACFIHDREKKWKLVPQLPLSEIGKKKTHLLPSLEQTLLFMQEDPSAIYHIS